MFDSLSGCFISWSPSWAMTTAGHITPQHFLLFARYLSLWVAMWSYLCQGENIISNDSRINFRTVRRESYANLPPLVRKNSSGPGVADMIFTHMRMHVHTYTVYYVYTLLWLGWSTEWPRCAEKGVSDSQTRVTKPWEVNEKLISWQMQYVWIHTYIYIHTSFNLYIHIYIHITIYVYMYILFVNIYIYIQNVSLWIQMFLGS